MDGQVPFTCICQSRLPHCTAHWHLNHPQSSYEQFGDRTPCAHLYISRTLHSAWYLASAQEVFCWLTDWLQDSTIPLREWRSNAPTLATDKWNYTTLILLLWALVVSPVALILVTSCSIMPFYSFIHVSSTYLHINNLRLGMVAST